MKYEQELRTLMASLAQARETLTGASHSYPVLGTSSRAISRLSRAVMRPMRVAILGESNSGKSSVANLIVGALTLPTLAVANTRLPTLLRYAPRPAVGVLRADGESVQISASDNISPEGIVRIEAWLPSEVLKWIEILDCPGSENPLFSMPSNAAVSHAIDAAIWTTAATQAWRETERTAWLDLPGRVRARGLLAITNCDLISTQEDLGRLRARMEHAAKPYFHEICFVSARRSVTPGAADDFGGANLLVQLGLLAEQFYGVRFRKAVDVAQRLASRTLERLEAEERSI